MYLLGSAYTFTANSNKQWSQEAKLVASDGATNDNFGWSISMYNKMIAVGAWLDNNYIGTNIF